MDVRFGVEEEYDRYDGHDADIHGDTSGQDEKGLEKPTMM